MRALSQKTKLINHDAGSLEWKNSKNGRCNWQEWKQLERRRERRREEDGGEAVFMGRGQ
jgi:hypothetical protein